MHKILEHKATFIVATVALVLALGALIYVFIPSHPVLDTATAAPRDISEDVTATGKIDAAEDVTLSFRSPGAVSSITTAVGDHVYKGQVLASLDASDLYASLRGAQATIAVQEANLSSLSKGARPQQLAVNKQAVNTAGTALETTLQDAYLKATDAVQNKVDTLFTNGGTVNPQYGLWTQTVNDKTAIDQARIVAGEALSDISAKAKSGSYDNSSLDAVASDLKTIQSFIGQVNAQMGLMNTSNSGLTQAQIDAYNATVNGAATEVNGAVAAFNGSRQGLNTALDQLDLAQASGTPDALTAQQAMVAQANASADAIQSQIAHALIVAPFDGVVSSIVPKVGEQISAGAPAIGLLSDGALTIDVYIPENDIAKVSANASATVAISAYGPTDLLSAHVSSIDLSPTTVSGVGSYKTTLVLDTATSTDTVRAGMSATVVISGRKATGVLAVPTSALIQKADGAYALVKNGNAFQQVKVQTGLSDDSYTQIVSGLSAGDQVAAFGGQ